MENVSLIDISQRLQAEAKKDRGKMIGGAAVLMILLLALAAFTYINAPNLEQALAVLVPSMFALIAISVILNMRLMTKMEHDSFGEGMHLVMESVPMSCSLMDSGGNVIYCNDEAPRLFGVRDKTEYSTRLFTDLLPEFQPDGSRSMVKAGEFIKTAITEGEANFEWVQHTSSQMPLPLKVSIIKVFFQGKDHLMFFSSDRRESLALQRREEAFHERMQAILDASPMVCAIFDADGYVLEVNKEAENMFGIPDRKAFVDNFVEFQPEFQPGGVSTRKRLLEVAQKAIQHGTSRHEWLYQLRDGTPIPAEEVMRAIHVDGQTFIITYIRDLREVNKAKERDALIQQNVRVMAEQLNAHVVEQSAAVTQSAASIEEMIANIQSVTNALSKNALRVGDLQIASEVGHSGINEVADDIGKIAVKSESLLEINSVMQNIASQTNLLSMNAAIEAAHAGESGRGFAVVADEIRKLAESSSLQSKTISAVLKDIKGAIDKITKSIGNVLNKFDTIDEGIKTVAEQEHGILNAMEEQRQGGTQVLQAIGQLSDITHQVKEEARQMVEKQQDAMLKN